MKPVAIMVPGSVVTKKTAAGYLRRTAAFFFSRPLINETALVLHQIESDIVDAGFLTWAQVEQIEIEALN